MNLLDAIERHLHGIDPARVHKRYPPGECPWCDTLTNINAKVRAGVQRIIRDRPQTPPTDSS